MLNEIREKEKFYADFDYLTGILGLMLQLSSMAGISELR